MLRIDACGAPMNDAETAETLRRRIALYREYLKDGVESGLAAEYLKSMVADEAALAQIEGRGRKR